MRLGYFAMPMHPGDRPWAETLSEDRDAVVLADKLGWHDAFIGEHLTDRLESITNSIVFLASLASDTSSIKLGTGTSNLSHAHPVLVAANAAMLDHLSDGRLILGISPGALPSDAEILGILDQDRNKMFEEAINVILRLWEDDAPYDIDLPDNRFRVTTTATFNADIEVGALRKPLQQPRPEIVGTVVAPHSTGAIAMGRREFHPLSANFLQSRWLRSHWDMYAQGAAEAGRTASPDEWRIARTVFVADSQAEAAEYAKASPSSPYRFYYGQLLKKMRVAGRVALFKRNPEDPDDSVTLDDVLDDLVICGTPESVAEQVLALQEETGAFGELVYAGMDWADRDRGIRSMELMSEKVMPLVNAIAPWSPTSKRGRAATSRLFR